VLLSSLPGYAVTKVKFSGVEHEFTTIPGIKENVVQIILNIKSLRFISHKEEPVKVKLRISGKKEVTGAEIETPSDIEVINKDFVIANLTDSKAKLDLEMTIEKGIGYSPSEERGDEEKEIGVIAIDSLFSPIQKVNYEVENMRVGKRTDFDKITFTVETDGSISPEDSFKEASKILIKQFSILAQADEAELAREATEEMEEESQKNQERKEIRTLDKEEREANADKEEPKSSFDYKSLPLAELNLPKRVAGPLQEKGIDTLGKLAETPEEELKKVEGMGEKGIKEIKKVIGTFGMVLKG
jgi:DNA-directed RNA polymerase subunit alpha